MPLPTPIRIGTRGSPLALAQAEQVRARLVAASPDLADPAVTIVPIVTTGDRVQDRRLSEIGNKGLFVKEIEQALADGRIDLAAHSMKDVETWIDPRFAIGAVLPREDPREAFISLAAPEIRELPPRAALGTTSLRRQAQALAVRPDLRIVTSAATSRRGCASCARDRRTRPCWRWPG
jgi:hydroxymethylbilane synthase